MTVPVPRESIAPLSNSRRRALTGLAAAAPEFGRQGVSRLDQ